MLISLDIETESVTEDKDDALYPHLSRITVVGVWCPEFEGTFTDLNELKQFIDSNSSYVFLGHNFQFDLKHLSYHGVEIPVERWAHDTSLMASACTTKIPESWLEGYELKRREENKKLPTGVSHRAARHRSLKTLAPYFLKVKPFWENPANHANEEYVLKDCEYTYRLYQHFNAIMQEDQTLEFYQTWLMPKARMFQNAIQRGITIDTTKMQAKWLEAEQRATELKAKLDDIWAPAYKYYHQLQCEQIIASYDKKYESALVKAKDKEKCKARYNKLEAAALDKLEYGLNLDSPAQLLWLFKDYLTYDVSTFKGDESTGKEVLQKLAEQHEDVKLFIEYRKARKLNTSFFPSYQKHMRKSGTLHCSFNLDGTRTGRLSSSDINLQQQPPDVRDIFVSRENYSFITLDQSAIEPKIIAFLTEDPVLCDLMISGGDFHSRNAVVMFGLDCDDKQVKEEFATERRIAKELGLALLYGAGPRRIQQSAQRYGFIWPLSKCKEIYENFKSLYEPIFKFKKNLDRKAEAGKVVENVFGRKHVYSNPEDVYMKTFNALVQSSASDLLIDSGDKILQKFKQNQIDGHLILTVHDEIMFEVLDSQVQQAYPIVIEAMTGYDLKTKYGNIPLTVEGGIAKEWKK